MKTVACSLHEMPWAETSAVNTVYFYQIRRTFGCFLKLVLENLRSNCCSLVSYGYYPAKEEAIQTPP